MPNVALHGFSYSAIALDNLRSIPAKDRARIVKKIASLAANPHPPGCKKMKATNDGDEDVWRIRCGDYRALYVVRNITVVVIDIDHRKDIYR
jgi:mRNA interferase RelE/StbE